MQVSIKGSIGSLKTIKRKNFDFNFFTPIAANFEPR
jgi:hypothetical protein